MKPDASARVKQTKGGNKMRTYLYCEAGFVEKAQWLPNSWVNVVCPNNDDFEFLTQTLNVPESFLNDIADTDERPRTDTEGNWLLTILRIPVQNKQNGSLPFDTVPIKNYTEYKPIHDELKKLQNGWTNKRDKYEEAHRAELTLWNAASRYLHANLPKGTKTLPIAEWEQEYSDIKTQRDTDYTKLKAARAEVAELQKIRKCVDIALKAEQPEQTQNRTKRHDIDR